MSSKNIIRPIIEFIVGILLLPSAAAVVAYVSADENLSGIFGLTLVLSGAIVIIGLGIMYSAVKEFF